MENFTTSYLKDRKMNALLYETGIRLKTIESVRIVEFRFIKMEVQEVNFVLREPLSPLLRFFSNYNTINS